jgi:hypothetical protein
MINDHELMQHETLPWMVNAGLDGSTHDAYHQAFGWGFAGL